MSMSQTLTTPPPVVNDPPRRSVRGRRHLRAVVIALVAAWVVPLLANLAHVDWLLPVAILLGTASLIRGGRSLLDRLMLALGLLAGAVCLAGLLFSVWPWGLSPVAVSGCALTALVLLAVALRRLPALPRPSLADGWTALAGLATALLLGLPYLRRTTAGRLNLAMAGEDYARHFTLFDAIRAVGGYTWLHPDASAGTVAPNMKSYPQGSHLTYALLDNFLRSSSRPGPALRDFADMVGFGVVGYAMLTLCLCWAAQWIGGPLVRTGFRSLIVVAFITPIMVLTSVMYMFTAGYLSQAYGLTLLVLLVAVLARPVRSRYLQLLLICALVVGIGFSYYLYLPGACLAVLLWLAVHRTWLRSLPRWSVATALLTMAVSVVPIAVGVLAAGQTQALEAAAQIRVSRDFVLAVGLAVIAGILVGRGARRPVWRSYLLILLGVLAIFVALRANDLLHHKPGGYYPEKALVAVEMVVLAGVGALARLAPLPVRHPVRGSQGRLLRRLPPMVTRSVPVMLLAASMVVGFGLVWDDTPFRPRVTGPTANWGRTWWAGQINGHTIGQIIVNEKAMAKMVNGVPAQPGGLTLVLGRTRYASYQATLYLSSLQRTAGTTVPWAYWLLDHDLEDLEQRLVAEPGDGPVTLVAATPAAAEFVRGMQRRHPDLRVELVNYVEIAADPAPKPTPTPTSTK
jgi:hypothetical protein